MPKIHPHIEKGGTEQAEEHFADVLRKAGLYVKSEDALQLVLGRIMHRPESAEGGPTVRQSVQAIVTGLQLDSAARSYAEMEGQRHLGERMAHQARGDKFYSEAQQMKKRAEAAEAAHAEVLERATRAEQALMQRPDKGEPNASL